jgi:hypothetical protein
VEDRRRRRSARGERPEARAAQGRTTAPSWSAPRPKLVRTLAPVWLASPYEVPTIPCRRRSTSS